MTQPARTDASVITARDVVRVIEELAPPSLALEGDPVGLQLGRLDKPVERVCIALDAYPAVIEAAIEMGADFLLTHHPMLFRPLRCIDTGTARGRAVARALAADLVVYAAHTNLDVAAGGVNDVLADLLRLRNREILNVTGHQRLYKLVVFVPVSHKDAVLEAVCGAGAGHIGNYSHCTFQVSGEGTFLPLEGANPYLGRVGELEHASEVRLETIVPEDRRDAVVSAMLAAHPYEEIAYDLYPLALNGRPYGIGRVGDLEQPMSLRAFADTARHALGLPHIRFAGDPELEVRRVAVLGGSGRRWVSHALRRGAQVLVTSDCDHHTMAEAWQDGLAVIDATHAALERPVVPVLAERLKRAFGDNLDVQTVDIPEDPFHWI